MRFARRHLRALFAVVLTIVIVASQLANAPAAYAASYSVSWSSQSDFENNTAGGIATSTIISDATVTGSGAVSITASSSVTVPINIVPIFLDLLSTTTTTWTVPSDWNSGNNSIEVIGGGGGGGFYVNYASGGGGGGGGYSKISDANLTPGSVVSVQIGSGGAGDSTYGNTYAANGGDTYLCNSTSNCGSISDSGVIVGAKGGVGGYNGTTGGAGGSASSGVGTTKYSGGSGGTGANASVNSSGGGGGGGAAGPNGNGSAGESPPNSAGTGGGGGGNDGGSSTAGSSGVGGTGEDGTAGGSLGGDSGSHGSGGGGGRAESSFANGGNGGNGVDWDSAHGSGGGGGGSYPGFNGTGGPGGNFGGGGGGDGAFGTTNPGGSGAAGIIVIKYNPGNISPTPLATSTSGVATATILNDSSLIEDAGTGSITFFLSNDGGTTWQVATPGTAVDFNNPAGTNLEYKINLTGNATVTKFHVTYTPSLPTATIQNIKKDAGGDAQWVNISWNASLPANTVLEFRTRGATAAQGLNALYSAPWSDYYTATSTGTSSAPIQANGSGGATLPTYEYLEVQATLVSTDGVTSPTLNDLGLTYAINAPPQFNPNYPSSNGSGSQASEISDSSDPNWGKVRIDYSVLDPDTNSGTINPGQFQPSFEYRMNSSDAWHPISSTYLSAGATNLQNTLESSYTTYTAYWDTPNLYSPTAQIRVTANDNEIIYNTATSTTAAFTLDTTPPSVSSAHINGSSSTSTVSVSATEDTSFQDYLVTNDASGTPDGLNSSSGIWQSVSSTSLSLNLPWTLDSGTSTHSVYVVTRDIYGNTSTTTIVAPAASSNFEIHDISNVAANLYKLFVVWTPFVSAPGATFDHYEIWRSTDGSNYSLYQSVTDPTVNYYLDTDVSSTTTYYYKERTLDTDGDSSAFSNAASAQPMGEGGSSLPPVISAVSVQNIKNTSAEVVWITNTLSNSLVNYGASNSYGSSASSQTYVTNHSVYLTDLQPNTEYYLDVASTDFYSNSTSDNNAGASYTFTTNGGAVISNVTVNSISDKSATIFWNTDRSADSQVYYSTHADLSSPSQVGDSTLVSTTTSSGTYSHTVTLTGLSADTTYYFYVTSTDGSSNTTVSNNNGSYYSFLTTRDTTPPVISDISTPVLSSSDAVIVWQTDKLSDSQAEWGTTASTSEGDYANTTVLDSTPTLTHLVTLSGLSADSTYYFRVRSTDEAGNAAYSDEQTFTTPDENTAVIVIIRNGLGSGSSAAAPAAPKITATSVDPIDSFDATVNVTTDQDVRAVVDYGEVSSSTPDATYAGSAGASSLSATQAIKLSGLTPGTTYHYVVTVVNSSGLTAQSSDQTFTTKYLSEDLSGLSILSRAQDLQGKLEDILQSALPSLSPPFMSTPTVSSTTENSATIEWGTNIPAYTVLDYDSDANYQKNNQTYTNELSDIQDATTTHSITINNLQPGTEYHYSTHAFIFPQLIAKSADYTFTTKTNPITPEIFNVTPTSFDVAWTTDATTTSVIEYTDRATGITQSTDDNAMTTQHAIGADNLTSGHTFDVKVYGIDANGNKIGMDGSLSVTVPLDTTKPQITALHIDSNLVPGQSGIIQSIVSWQTDKPSNSTVYYEEGAGSEDQPLTNKVSNDTGFVQDHVVILPSLKPSTIYRIQVSSTDQSGNTILLPVRTIVTPQQSESIVDIIFKNFSSTFNFIP